MFMKKKLLNLLIAVLSSFSLFINYKNIYLNKGNFINLNGIIIALIFSIILYLFIKNNKEKITKEDIILTGLFSIFLLIGQSYRSVSSLSILFKNFMFIFTIYRFLSLSVILLYIIIYTKKIIKYYLNKNDFKENKFIKFFNKHPFIISLIIIIFCWSIYYVAFYPAVLSPDPSNQIKQFFNVKTKYVNYSVQINPNVNITNHHPVFHTMLLGSCIKLGRLILNDNFGLFIYTFMQGLFLAITLAYTVNFLKKRKVQNKFLIPLIFIYSLVPSFPFYAINTNKDVYYTTLIILLIMFIINFIEKYKNTKISLKSIILFFILSIFICLFRNNGVFLIILLVPFLCIFSKKNIKKLLGVTIIIFSLYLSYSKILLPKLGITGTSIREALSIPFQQTARFIKYHEDSLSKNDKKNISKVLDYEAIKKNYNPVLSDPVKNTFNKYATKKDLTNYFKTWFKGLISYPFTYIDATLNNIYGFFDPSDIHWYIYFKYYDPITDNNLVDYHYNNLESLRNFLSSYAYAFRAIPILGLIVSPGFNTWLLIVLLVYLIKNKKYDYLVILLPLYFSLLFCVLGPANNYYRYAMPYIFSMPLVTIYLLNLKRVKE